MLQVYRALARVGAEKKHSNPMATYQNLCLNYEANCDPIALRDIDKVHHRTLVA